MRIVVGVDEPGNQQVSLPRETGFYHRFRDVSRVACGAGAAFLGIGPRTGGGPRNGRYFNYSGLQWREALPRPVQSL